MHNANLPASLNEPLLCGQMDLLGLDANVQGRRIVKIPPQLRGSSIVTRDPTISNIPSCQVLLESDVLTRTRPLPLLCLAKCKYHKVPTRTAKGSLAPHSSGVLSN